jgi:transketolase
LDVFREHLPDQFIHAGISEQNMVDLASGLALSGKKVFLYAMAPFITARCYEQVKCVIASMNLPVTLIAVGVGLGYDHATLTHFTPEDIACMRALNGIEVLTPCDEESTEVIVNSAITNPDFRYIRLDRQAQVPVYNGNFKTVYERGFGHIFNGKDVAIIGCGILLKNAIAARKSLAIHGIDAGVIDLFRVKPINGAELSKLLLNYDSVLTVEEQLLEGGMGGAVAEVLVDFGVMTPTKRLGIRDGFAVVNGDRDILHGLYGIDTLNIINAVTKLVRMS